MIEIVLELAVELAVSLIDLSLGCFQSGADLPTRNPNDREWPGN